MLTDAAAYPSATIVDGWAARNDYYDKNKDALRKIIRAWIPANDYLLAKPEEALKVLHQKQYPNLSWEDIQELLGV